MDEKSNPTGQLEKDIERARQILQRGDLVAAPGANFSDRMKLVGEAIKLARRLEHPQALGGVNVSADKTEEQVRASVNEAEELARTLFQQAKITATNLGFDILKGSERTPGEILSLAKLLDKLDEFTVARRILDVARAHRDFGRDREERIRIVQRRALYTYKDFNQALGTRLSEALDFLEKEADLKDTNDQETLGLAGAIYKRKWELDRNERNLRKSLDYYRCGYNQKPWKDQGYTSINAAYILDLRASLDRGSPNAQADRDEAQRIRTEIVDLVPKMPKEPGGAWLEEEWFFYSTVGEAYFGLGEFEKAHDWLVTLPAMKNVFPPDWEFETSARQIANLVRVQSATSDFTTTPGWKAFEEFLRASPLGKGGDVNSEAVRRLPDGKVGLALSGGGFRASLFHIGVLARLAELDILRRVEVISCVSGGSILGAHYYLEVRKLLQERPDAKITKQDYIEIVRRLERDFLAGVQTNIRTNVLTDARTVRRMLYRDYSRTTRLGELYEEQLYARVADDVGTSKGPDGKVRERYMHELAIQPCRESGRAWEEFKPRNHNWRRQAKAPILILNATTLNTGHNWQFTATYMGEAPATIHREVDGVYRLRRKYYTEAPDSPRAPQKVRLGAAVAASSCVPALFEPIAFEEMYESQTGAKPISVKLVDGGVCDNQGVAGLLEQDCTVLLVSDGSGQMDATEIPSAGSVMVAMRSNGILQARVRGTQYQELDARLSTSMNGLMFVHLKKDLDNTPVNWKNCPPESRLAPPDDRLVLTKYGIPKEVQRRLAAIRTDLDSFCDQEAYALMLSAYRMTEYEYRVSLARPDEPEPAAVPWDFRRIEPLIKDTGAQSDFTSLLDAGGSLFLKIWKLDEDLKSRARRLQKLAVRGIAAAGVMALIVFAALVLALWSFASGHTHVVPAGVLTWVGAAVTVGLFAMALLTLVGLLIYRRKLRGVPQPIDTVAHFAVGSLMVLLGGPAARYHMRNYEQPYLDRGKLER